MKTNGRKANGSETNGSEANGNADGWHDPLAHFRPQELQTLVSSELPEFLQTHHLRLGRLSDLATA